MTTIDYSREAHGQVERLYLAHQRPLTAYLARLVGDHDLAQDLCQETFLKAMRAWEQHDQRASAVGWLYQIAKNTAFDSLRRQRVVRWTSLDAADAARSGDISAEERLIADTSVRAALARLPRSYRAALLLISGGYSSSEVASVLRCSATAVRMRLYRARARLRAMDEDLN
jgi:RNA polymerase sigma-70 factor (ECF subfamily)